MRPVELVALSSVEHVILFRAFFDCLLNREPHQQQPHAMRAIRGIEAGLVEVENASVAESVKRCGGLAIELQSEQSQPSALQCERADLVMKCNVRGDEERV